MKRMLYAVGAVVLGLVLPMLVAATPAQADTETKTIVKPFARERAFYSKPLGRCVHMKVTGRISATYVRSYEPGPYPPAADYQSLIDPKLRKPVMKVWLTRTCTAGSAAANATKATLRQSYYYWKCSGDPSISVSYPWSVGVSVTPTCGNEKVARRSTTYAVRGSSWTQYNSGVKATWDKHSYGETSTKVSSCLHGVADVTVYRGRISDSVQRNLGRICITV